MLLISTQLRCINWQRNRSDIFNCIRLKELSQPWPLSYHVFVEITLDTSQSSELSHGIIPPIDLNQIH